MRCCCDVAAWDRVYLAGVVGWSGQMSPSQWGAAYGTGTVGRSIGSKRARIQGSTNLQPI